MKPLIDIATLRFLSGPSGKSSSGRIFVGFILAIVLVPRAVVYVRTDGEKPLLDVDTVTMGLGALGLLIGHKVVEQKATSTSANE